MSDNTLPCVPPCESLKQRNSREEETDTHTHTVVATQQVADGSIEEHYRLPIHLHTLLRLSPEAADKTTPWDDNTPLKEGGESYAHDHSENSHAVLAATVGTGSLQQGGQSAEQTGEGTEADWSGFGSEELS